MGVPAFFRWLSQKYPSIVQHCVEKRGQIIDEDGRRESIDLTEPNPNREEFDNLYLDMNGIIHPCTHPENKPAPKNESEMFVSMFEYIDRLFALIRPRRLLYMAIDGVAPRAKMNQQRSRRFRAAKESQDKLLTIDRLRAELITKGAKLPSPKDASEQFDSNCITPGTPFMDRLAIALRYYVYARLNSNPAWKNLQIILSDSNAPGEGEHKIMDFIRRQRNSPTHDPNTRHCLCGADADLIMLGLATHEPHFTIIREEFKPNQQRPCELCGQYGHEMEDCVGAPKEDGVLPPPSAEVEFIFIKLAVLRQYLEKDLQIPNITFKWELERVIDDWVFMCFFVGNDFLPHLPSLEIREGAIDKLIELYKSAVSETGGWLTDSGYVHLDRVQLIMTELGRLEDKIFKSRRDDELSFRDRKKRQQNYGQKRQSWNAPSTGILAPVAVVGGGGVASRLGPITLGPKITAEELHQSRRTPNVNWVEQCLQNQEAAVSLRAMLKTGSKHKQPSTESNGATQNDDESVIPRKRVKGRLGGVDASALKEKPQKGQPEMDEDEKIDNCDEVRLWEDGWRARYYQSKFGVDPADAPEFCLKVAHEYVIGLCWVLAYYYQGCLSWDWYYPYHYAPFASDFCDVASVDPGFSKKRTKPFCPLEQLMGVFPAASRSHVPPAWQDLMTDPDSPIIDFYPTDFKVDLNGKRYLWMGVALLPFVDEVRLLKALDSRRSLLSAEERSRNLRRPELYFVHADGDIGKFVASIYETPNSEDGKEIQDYEGLAPTYSTLINAALTEGVAGHIWPDYDNACLPGHQMPSGVPMYLPEIPSIKQRAISAFFENPEYPFGHIFRAVLLDSVKIPPPFNLLPSTQRGRGRGRGGGFRRGGNSSNLNDARLSFDGQHERSNSYNRNDRDRSQNRNNWDNNPADRMIRHNLPRYDNYNSPHRQHPNSNHSNYPVYPPAYPPIPSINSAQFVNPYQTGPPMDRLPGWNNVRGKSNYQNQRRGSRQYGWQPPRGGYY